MSTKKKIIASNNNKQSLIAVSHFSGPLPDPKSLEHYNEIVPGCANRLITLVENQSHHRMSIEKKYVNSEIILNFFGLFFGFIIALVTTIGPMYLIYKGHAWTATLFTIPVGIVIAYLVTRKHKK